MEEKGISRSKAKKIASDLAKKPDLMRGVNVQMTHYALQSPRDRSAWQTAQEENPRIANYDKITVATKARVIVLTAEGSSSTADVILLAR